MIKIKKFIKICEIKMMIWIKIKISTLKSRIKEYFSLKNWLFHLESVIRKFYIFSIGFNDIYYGNKNIKRFKICIFNCFIVRFIELLFLSFVFSDYMFSLVDIPSFSEHLTLRWLKYFTPLKDSNIQTYTSRFKLKYLINYLINWFEISSK